MIDNKQRYEVVGNPKRVPGESDAEYLFRVYGPPSAKPYKWGPFTVRWLYFRWQEIEVFLKEYNHHNRTQSKVTLARYSNQVAAGDWMVNGDTVRFDSLNRLINGQHTLESHVRAQRDCLILEVTGLDPEVPVTIDIPYRRSLAASLILRDIDRPKDVQTAVRWVCRIGAGRGAIAGKSGQVNYIEQLRQVDAWRDRVEDAVEYTATGEVGKALTAILGSGVPAALYAHVFPTHRGVIREFYRVLALSDGWRRPIQSCPAWTLAQKLKTRPWRDQGKQDLLLWLVRAWNAWAEGRPLTRIDGLDRVRWDDGTEGPEDYRKFPAIVGCAACAGWRG